MFNRQRTFEVFGYDIDPTKKRIKIPDGAKDSLGNRPKSAWYIQVIDNCPSCDIERTLALRQSRKDKPCIKCFHNTDFMKAVKLQQAGREFSEEHKQRMKDSHWSKNGGVPHNKGVPMTEEQRANLSERISEVEAKRKSDMGTKEYRIMKSCNVRQISRDQFDDFLTEKNIRLRGSKRYKNWEKAVLERDQVCQCPGCTESNKRKLTAHHKSGFAWDKKNRYKVSNGVALCHLHHRELHDAFGKQKVLSGWTEEFFLKKSQEIV